MSQVNQIGGNTTSSAKVSDVNAVITALNAVEARLVTLEADHAALRAEIAKRNAAGRLEELEAFEKMNRAALQAIFTVFHPEPAGHGDFALVATEAQHTLLHEWLEKLGGRAGLPPDVRMR